MDQPLSNSAYCAWLLGHRLRITLACRVELRRGTVSPWGMVAHPKLLLVESGNLDYRLGGQRLALGSGSLLFRPAHSLASWRVDGRDGVRFAFCEFAAAPGGELPAFPRPLLRLPADSADAASLHRLHRLGLEGSGAAVQMEAEGELKGLLARFLRHARHAPAAQAPPRSTFAVHAAIRILCDEYARPDPLRALPERVQLSAAYLRACFQRETGQSPQTFLRRLRLDAARDLLLHSGLSVKEAAAAVGYADPLYFSRLYRAHHRRPPSADRLPPMPPPRRR
ncbi:MAG: AraC family transcriptional regulator [Lentisphaeria bacterium]|jgi:AraC-like DNA-binding protein